MLYMPLRQGSSRCFFLDPYKYTISFLCEGWSALMWHNITDSPNLKVSGPRLGPAIVEPLSKTSQNVAMNCNTQIFINFLLQIFRPASYSMFPVGAVLGVQASSNIIQPKTHGESQVPLYGLVYGDLVMQRKHVGLKICPNWIKLDHGLTDPDLWLKDVETVGGGIAR